MAITKMQYDELWTSYILRRFEEKGIKPRWFDSSEARKAEFEVVASIELDEESCLDLERRIDLPFLSKDIEDPKKSIFSISRADELYATINASFSEYASLSIEGAGMIRFSFKRNGQAIAEFFLDEGVSQMPHPFNKYREIRNYNAHRVVDEIIAYAEDKFDVNLERNDVGKIKRPVYSEIKQGQLPQQASSNPPILEEMLRILKKLESRTAQHPMMLQGWDKHLENLYIKSIEEDPANLKSFEYKGQHINYVLVDSSGINNEAGNQAGTFHNNLIFVAKDAAREDWQQKIVAYHEHIESRTGSHEKAKAKEALLAKSLGKSREYGAWRKNLNDSKI